MTTQPPQPATPTLEPAQRHTAAASQPTRSAWRLVAAREIVVRLTNRAFLVSTLLTLVLIAAFGIWSVIQGGSTTTHRVLVTTSDASTLVTSAAEARAVGDVRLFFSDASVRATISDEDPEELDRP